MGLMDSFNGLSPIGKVAVVGAAGGAVLMFMNRGGAAAGGGQFPDGTIILPENYEAMGLMSGTSGAEWGGGGYEYFAEVNQQNMDLLRRIWDTQRPPATGLPTVPTPPGNPTPGVIDSVRQRISNLNQRQRLNRHSIALMRRGGMTEEEQRRAGLMRTKNERIRDRVTALRATQVPVQTTTTTPPA